MTMAPEDLERFLAMGTNEEALIELLRQQRMAEDEIAATRGHDTTVDAGGGNLVPNYGDAIGGMFARGRAEKKKFQAEGDAANNRAARDQDIRAWFKGTAYNAGDAPPSQGDIQGSSSMPMPSMPQVTDPAAGPPAPAMGGPPNAAPEASPSPAPAPVPAQTPQQAPPGLGDAVPTSADMPQAPIGHSPGAPGKAPVDPAMNPDGTMSIVEMLRRQFLGRG